jgi:hypothetical protein
VIQLLNTNPLCALRRRLATKMPPTVQVAKLTLESLAVIVLMPAARVALVCTRLELPSADSMHLPAATRTVTMARRIITGPGAQLQAPLPTPIGATTAPALVGGPIALNANANPTAAPAARAAAPAASTSAASAASARAGHAPNGVAVILDATGAMIERRERDLEWMRQQADVKKMALQVLSTCIGRPKTSAVPASVLGKHGRSTSHSTNAGDSVGTGKESWLARQRVVGQAVREANGIRTLLQLLRTSAPPSHADGIRALACEALLGLSRDPVVLQILQSYQLAHTLSTLTVEPVDRENKVQSHLPC